MDSNQPARATPIGASIAVGAIVHFDHPSHGAKARWPGVL